MVNAYKNRFERMPGRCFGPIDTEYEALAKLITGQFPTP